MFGILVGFCNYEFHSVSDLQELRHVSFSYLDKNPSVKSSILWITRCRYIMRSDKNTLSGQLSCKILVN